jgi:hypothetical protein
MYRGFNLELNIDPKESLIKDGEAVYAEFKAKVSKSLSQFISADNSINGTSLVQNWFPGVKADIFISHSHQDEQMAKTLAGWLYYHFRLKAFIDSCIWGNSADLQRAIDNRYCRNTENNNYNYQKRNLSTSHVHAMLSIALANMIYKTECLIFLNTPSSVSARDVVDRAPTQSTSPWIYSEIALSQMLRQPLEFYRKTSLQKTFSKGGPVLESLNIKYDLPLSGLTPITRGDLENWQQTYSAQKKTYSSPLDCLYGLAAQKTVLGEFFEDLSGT